jgi:spermidine synthase
MPVMDGRVQDGNHRGWWDSSRPETVARDESPRGSVVLRRRRDVRHDATGDVLELIVNGAFAMDTVDTSTERLLARAALGRVGRRERLAVVVAGLGLGFTVREVLASDRVARVDVVEIEPAVIDWVRTGLVPATAGVLADPRVTTHAADVRSWAPTLPAGSVDAVLLDVDNGPDFLVHGTNAEVYETAFLATVRRVLRPDGVLAVWSATASPALRHRLDSAVGPCDELHEQVSREGRLVDYYLYLAVRGH